MKNQLTIAELPGKTIRGVLRNSEMVALVFDEGAFVLQAEVDSEGSPMLYENIPAKEVPPDWVDELGLREEYDAYVAQVEEQRENWEKATYERLKKKFEG